MKFVSYRSGSTCGMTCGPIDGPFFGESMFYDNKGNSFFVLVSIYDCDLKVSVSKYSLYDIEYQLFNSSSGNTDKEIEKLEKLKIKEDDFDVSAEDDEILKNGYGQYFPGYEQAVNFAIDIYHKDWDNNLSKKELESLLYENVDKMKIEYKPFYDSNF